MDCTNRQGDKTNLLLRLVNLFYQELSHSLSVDTAKICNSENNPRGRPVFYDFGVAQSQFTCYAPLKILIFYYGGSFVFYLNVVYLFCD